MTVSPGVSMGFLSNQGLSNWLNQKRKIQQIQRANCSIQNLHCQPGCLPFEIKNAGLNLISASARPDSFRDLFLHKLELCHFPSKAKRLVGLGF